MKIKFSYNYKKLNINRCGTYRTCGKAGLLDVLKIDVSDLSQRFVEYDTDNGAYKLPKKGAFLMLIFEKEPHAIPQKHDLFTTIRRYTPKKHRYYRSKIGELFEVEVNSEK